VTYKSAYSASKCFATQDVTKSSSALQLNFTIEMPLIPDELFLRFSTNLKNTTLHTHDSLSWLPRIPTKRLLSTRDLGSRIFPSIQGAALLQKTHQKGVILTSCERPFSSGSLTDGQLDIGIARQVKYDDDKGMPDGITDATPSTHLFTIAIGRLEKVGCGE
jgi:hypothetical protein